MRERYIVFDDNVYGSRHNFDLEICIINIKSNENGSQCLSIHDGCIFSIYL